MRTLSNFLTILIFPLLAIGQVESSFDIVSGVSFSYRNLTLHDQTETLETVKSIRDEIENGKINWRFGFNYNEVLHNKFAVKVGLRLMSVGYITKNTSELVFGSQHNGTGGRDPNLGITQYLKLVSDHFFVELPVALRYQAAKGRIHPFIEAGVAPSLYLTTRSALELDGSKEVDYGKINRETFNNVQIAGLFSFGLDYEQKNGNRLFLQPTVRYHLTRLNEAPLRENLFNAGVEVGYRIALNKNTSDTTM